MAARCPADEMLKTCKVPTVTNQLKLKGREVITKLQAVFMQNSKLFQTHYTPETTLTK